MYHRVLFYCVLMGRRGRADACGFSVLSEEVGVQIPVDCPISERFFVCWVGSGHRLESARSAGVLISC